MSRLKASDRFLEQIPPPPDLVVVVVSGSDAADLKEVEGQHDDANGAEYQSIFHECIILVTFCSLGH